MPLPTDKFRRLGRFTIATGLSVTPVPASGFLDLFGPALQFPIIQLPNAIRIVHARATWADASNSTALFLLAARITVTAAKGGGSIQVPYRDYQSPTVPGGQLRSNGFGFGVEDPEEIRASDYVELTGPGAAQGSPGNFAIQLSSTVQNGTAAVVNLTNTLTVLFDLLSLEKLDG